MIYKPIPSLNNLYEINEYGTVLRSIDGRLMRPFINERGYLQLLLRDKKLINHPRAHIQNDGRVQVHCKLHQLVAEVFIGEKPAGKIIDHIDRNKTNNHFSNLRYATISENWHNTSAETKKKMSEVSKDNAKKMLESCGYQMRRFSSKPLILKDILTGSEFSFASADEAGRFVLENYGGRMRTKNCRNIARILGKGGIRYNFEIRRII